MVVVAVVGVCWDLHDEGDIWIVVVYPGSMVWRIVLG